MRNALIAICWLWCCVAVLGAQTTSIANDNFTYRALGTGQTTGHIADLIVNNTLNEEIIAAAQWCFIPSQSGFQSYVARIPAGITIPAKGMVTIPLIGYCTDVSTPPVPAGQTMPPVKDWVPVEGSTNATPAIAVGQRVLPGVPSPEFQVEQAGFLQPLSAFNAIKNSSKTKLELLYPGTDIPLGGTYAVNKDPDSIAPMIVVAVRLIEEVVANQQANNQLITPFYGDPLREREAIVQQTVWIMMAALAGNDYTQEDFAKKIYEQYQHNTGTMITNLPAPQKDRLTNGVDVFWSTFQATGTSAKVFAE